MLSQCITFVKIYCITCITLNYCLTETIPSGYRLYSGELDPQQKGNPLCSYVFTLYSYVHSQLSFVQFACKDRFLTKL